MLKNKRYILLLVFGTLVILAGIFVLFTKIEYSKLTVKNVNNYTASVKQSGSALTNGSLRTGDEHFGYNGFFLESLLGRNREFVNADTESLGHVLEATQATLLRFPGGTRANSYVFDLSAPGLGEDSSFDKLFDQNFIVDYAKFAKSFGVKTVYVMNLSAHFPSYYGGNQPQPPRLKGKTDEEIIDMNIRAVEYLLDQGLEVPYVEFGNELYLHNLSKLRNLKVANKDASEVSKTMQGEMDKYETLINKYNEALATLSQKKSSQLGRDIKFKTGVPVVLLNGNQSKPYAGAYQARNQYWNERVKDLPVTALVPHSYSNLSRCRNAALNTSQRAQCMEEDSKKDIEELPLALQMTKGLAPEKEIWVTEFNSGLGFESTDVLAQSSFVNSTAHVDYLQKVATIFREQSINIFLMHMFYSSGSTSAVANNTNDTRSVKIEESSRVYIKPTICAFIPENLTTYRTKFSCR